MNARRTAIVVGVLFIAATGMYMLGGGFLDPILAAPDYLSDVSANENRVLTGMLIEFVNHLAVFVGESRDWPSLGLDRFVGLLPCVHRLKPGRDNLVRHQLSLTRRLHHRLSFPCK